ncbi:MAG: hypothetical protein ACRDP7_16965 [Trebonia sp.]
MAATITKLDTRGRGPATAAAAGGPTVRAAIDAFLDTPKVRANPNTARAYTGVLDRTAGVIGADRKLAGVAGGEVAGAHAGLWGTAAPATWNRNRAAVGSWLTWCAGKQHWTAPALPGPAERRRENTDDTKAVSRTRIDRLCRRRDVPLREKTLWRMLYESASRASAVLALNIEDLDLPGRQAKITAKGGDTMWITWGTVPPAAPPDRRPRARSPRPTTKDGSTRPGTPSSRPSCAAPGKCFAPSPRTWSSRKSGATSWPTTRSAP